MPFAEFREKMPDRLPPEIAELVASGQGVKATMQLAKSTGISAAFAQVVVKFFEIRP